MGLSDSLPGRATVMSSRRALVASLPPGRASQVPRLIFPRALPPTTPEGPATACPLLPHRLSGFILVGGLATFVFLTRPNRVHLRYGSRVRLPSFASPIAPIPRSFGYMSNRQFTW